jgi:hypothetical protein
MPAPVVENDAAAAPAAAFILNLTDRAADKVKDFAARMPDAAGKALRVFIQGGGARASSMASPSMTNGRRTTW